MDSEGDFPSAQINRFKVMLKSYFDKKAAEFGIAGSHVPYIALLLKSKEGITQAETGRILGYDKANSSRVLTELESRQIIHRFVSDKRTLIRLTPRGEEIGQQIRRITREWHKTSFEGINKEDMEVFLRVQKKMFENCIKAIEERV